MIKGIHKNHTKRKGSFVFTRMIRTKEAIRRNQHAGMFVEVVKTMKHNYTKRKIKNGKTVALRLTDKNKTNE